MFALCVWLETTGLSSWPFKYCRCIFWGFAFFKGLGLNTDLWASAQNRPKTWSSQAFSCCSLSATLTSMTGSNEHPLSTFRMLWIAHIHSHLLTDITQVFFCWADHLGWYLSSSIASWKREVWRNSWKATAAGRRHLTQQWLFWIGLWAPALHSKKELMQFIVLSLWLNSKLMVRFIYRIELRNQDCQDHTSLHQLHFLRCKNLMMMSIGYGVMLEHIL